MYHDFLGNEQEDMEMDNMRRDRDMFESTFNRQIERERKMQGIAKKPISLVLTMTDCSSIVAGLTLLAHRGLTEDNENQYGNSLDAMSKVIAAMKKVAP